MVTAGQVLLCVLFAWKIDYLHSIIWNSDWPKWLGNDWQPRTLYGPPLLTDCTFACSPNNHAFFVSPASRDQMETASQSDSTAYHGQAGTCCRLPLFTICTLACGCSNRAFFISPASRDQMETARVIQLPYCGQSPTVDDLHLCMQM